MRVKCIKDYYDLEKKKTIAKDEEFEVSDTRGKELTTTANKAGYPLCEEIKTPDTGKEAKQRPKKKEA